jgi:hypothetical protein
VDRDELEPTEDDAYVYCERCGEMNTLEQVHRCPFCMRAFCQRCGVLWGAQLYCSGACGRAMLMGDEEGEGGDDESG